MRRLKLVLGVAALMVAIMAASTAPAAAQEVSFFNNNDDDDLFDDDDDVIFRGVGDGGDFGIEDSGASIVLSPEQTTTGDQGVFQAASAAD